MNKFFLFLITNIIVYTQPVEWQSFNTSNSGLPSNSVKCIAQDSSGTYWIGTWDAGLVKFDGTNWTIFNTDNSGLTHNSIFNISIDRFNNVWLATNGGGVVKFNGENWYSYTPSNSGVPDKSIYGIAFDKKNNVWIATSYKGLINFDGENFINYEQSNSPLSDNKVTSVFVDDSGKIWVASLSNFYCIEDSLWLTIGEINSSIQPAGIYDINQFTDSKIMVCYKFGPIALFNDNSSQIFDEDNYNLPFYGFYSVISDKNNVIWAGNFGRGVIYFDGSEWKRFYTANSPIQDDKIFDVFVDKNNNKWFAGFFGGITIYNEDGINLISH